MKQYIDFCATLQAELSAKLKLASQLKRLWGTEVKDGVEVYKNQFTIWPGTEDETVGRVLKLFGIKVKDITSQSKDGITRLYLWFNPAKMDSSSLTKEAIATIIETDVPFGTYREFVFRYTDMNDPMKFTGWTKEQIQTYVEANVTVVSSTGISSSEDLAVESIDDVIGGYIIAENGVDFERTLLEASVIPIPGETSVTGITANYVSGITLKYRYKRTGYLNDNSPIVEDIYGDILDAGTDKDALLRVSGFKSRFGNRGLTNTLWYNGQIRTDAARLLKKHDYANLMFGSLDTGYDKVKKKGWLILVAIVIVVVVTVLTWNPGAGLAAGAAIGATEVLTAIAITAAAVTLALTVYSYILSRYGETGSAEYVGRWIKVTGTIAMITGVAAALSSLMQRAGQIALEEGAKSAAVGSVEAATIQGVTVTSENMVVEITASNVYDAAVSMVTDSVSNSTWLSKLSMASKVVNPVMEWRQENLQKELTSMSEECRKQQEALAEEYDKNMQIGIEDIKMSTRPLTMANIQFEVDYQYEPTKFNIQRASFVRSGMNIIS